MTNLTHYDFTAARSKNTNTAEASTRWTKDIAKFDALLDIAGRISGLQTIIMEYIRETTEFLKRRDTQDSKSAKVRLNADFKNTLQKLNTLHPALGAFVDPDKIQTSETSLKQAKAKLAKTDAKLAEVRERLQRLERKILTHEPETHSEAVKMIQFLSRLFKAHGKVEDEYLADVLDACANATSTPPYLVASEPYAVPSAA